MPPKIILFVIATGQRYWPYVQPLLDSAAKYLLPHDVLLFTDNPYQFHQCTAPGVIRPVKSVVTEPLGYPNETLHRYHTILSQEGWILSQGYQHIFYCDVDMLFVDRVDEEILADGITATLHAGYVNSPGTYEERPWSTAYVVPGTGRRYYAGGFNGGTVSAYLEMARTIRQNVDIDSANKLTALWHDESHLNRYLHHHEPAKVLSPAYCFPEPLWLTNPDPEKVRLAVEALRLAGKTECDIWAGERYEPKLMCLEKRWRS